MNVLENCRYYAAKMCPFTAAASQYHGLVNQGATCYLNSVLQVLFMTEDFREAVGGHPDDTECIDPHLASLFDDLKGHEAYTYKITKALGIKNVYEQRDAAEYFQKILGLTSPEASKIFHGLLTDMTRCSTCGEKTEADGAFWHLPLALVDSKSEVYSVLDGIQTFFRVSDFSGGNQMYCEKCDAKSAATIQCVVKRHPEVLMLLLKRFEFDYRYMTYVKINCNVVVPYTVQIPENQIYELYALVEHFGDLRSGHYTATVKSQDDERWHLFNDSSVSVLDYQPFQLENLEESNSAYLLFYRKKTEVSSPGGFPSATSGFDEDVMMRREREEVEKAAEVREEPAVTVSIDKNEETRTKDIVSVECREMGLSPHSYSVVEDPDNGGYARQSIRDVQYVQDSHAEKQRNKDEIVMDDEEEADDRAEKRETSSSRETQPDDEDNDKGRLDGVRHSMHPQQDRVNIQKDEKRMDEQPKRRRTEKFFSRDAEHEGLDDVRQEADDQAEKRETSSRETQPDDEDNDKGRLYSVRHRRPQESLKGEDLHSTDQMYRQEVSSMHPQQVCVNVQIDEKTMDEQPKRRRTEKHFSRDAEHERLDDARQNLHENLGGKQEVVQDYDSKPVNVDKQELMEIDHVVDKDRKSARGKLTIADLHYDGIQSRGGDHHENMPKDNQSSMFYHKHPRDVKGDEPQKRWDDRHAPQKGRSERQQDQNRGLDEVRQNTSVHVSLYKDAAKQAKEQESKGDYEHIYRRADSPFRPAGLTGSSRVTENRGSGEESQAKARNENTMEGRRGSKQHNKLDGKIIDEEIRMTQSGVRRSIETNDITIEPVAGTSQGSSKRWWYNDVRDKRKSDPKTNAKITLAEGVCNLNLNDSKPQKHRAEERSDVELQAGKKHAKKERGKKKRRWWHRLSPLKQNRKEKKKRNKTTGCWHFIRKSRKNAVQSSESD